MTLLVVAVQALGEVVRSYRGLRRQEFDDEHRTPEATGGVESRCDFETDIFGLDRRAVESDDIDECLQPERWFLGNAFQTVLDADAVFVAERHHIGNEAERTETDGIEKELAQFGRDFVAGAESLCDRPREFERDTGAGQPTEGIVAGQPRVNDRRGIRNIVEHFVVVSDDQIQPDSPRFFGFRNRGDPAIDGD